MKKYKFDYYRFTQNENEKFDYYKWLVANHNKFKFNFHIIPCDEFESKEFPIMKKLKTTGKNIKNLYNELNELFLNKEIVIHFINMTEPLCNPSIMTDDYMIKAQQSKKCVTLKTPFFACNASFDPIVASALYEDVDSGIIMRYTILKN